MLLEFESGNQIGGNGENTKEAFQEPMPISQLPAVAAQVETPLGAAPPAWAAEAQQVILLRNCLWLRMQISLSHHRSQPEACQRPPEFQGTPSASSLPSCGLLPWVDPVHTANTMILNVLVMQLHLLRPVSGCASAA